MRKDKGSLRTRWVKDSKARVRSTIEARIRWRERERAPCTGGRPTAGGLRDSPSVLASSALFGWEARTEIPEEYCRTRDERQSAGRTTSTAVLSRVQITPRFETRAAYQRGIDGVNAKACALARLMPLVCIQAPGEEARRGWAWISGAAPSARHGRPAGRQRQRKRYCKDFVDASYPPH